MEMMTGKNGEAPNYLTCERTLHLPFSQIRADERVTEERIIRR